MRLHGRRWGTALAAAGLAWTIAGAGAGVEESGAPAEGIVGLWQGALEVGAIQLRLVVEIRQADDGTLNGDMDSLDQGAMDLPFSAVSFEDGNIRLEMENLGGLFEGRLSEDGAEMVGTWTQGGASLPLTLKRTTEAPRLNRPQEPRPPYPYDEEEVSYENPDAGLTLAGTLTKPRQAGPFAAVLLITGSGAQDRNETVAGHQPFLILADYLTRQGIAVLRVDDRGVGGSTGSMREATSEDFAGDVLAGVAYLKSRADIDPERIGLIGHSEGGIVAPMVAVQSEDVAFIVLMAGTGVPGEEIIALQSELISRAMGLPQEERAQNQELQQRILDTVKANPDPEALQAELDTLIEEASAGMDDTQRKALEAQVKRVESPWIRFFLTYDPRPTLRRVQCPVLAVNGELDLQVPPSQNLPEIAAALEGGGNRDYAIVKLGGLNHLFQRATTGAPSEYAQIEETMAPEALDVIAQWILRHVSTG